MTQLLKDENWSEMIEPLIGKTVGFVAIPGNAGDTIHKVGAIQLMERAGVTWYYEDFSDPDTVAWPDVLVYPGGGVLGKVYDVPVPSKNINSVPNNVNLRIRPSFSMRLHCENSGKPFIVFPQSFVQKDNVTCDHLWVRENYSLNFSNLAKFAHDTSLAYEFPKDHIYKLNEPKFDRIVSLKHDQDSENIIRSNLDMGDPTSGIKDDDHVSYIVKASEYKTIITDRCHFAIAGLIANQYSSYQREVVLLPNSYHKNLGIWECSLKQFGVKFWNRVEFMEKTKNGR